MWIKSHLKLLWGNTTMSYCAELFYATIKGSIEQLLIYLDVIWTKNKCILNLYNNTAQISSKLHSFHTKINAHALTPNNVYYSKIYTLDYSDIICLHYILFHYCYLIHWWNHGRTHTINFVCSAVSVYSNWICLQR